ncbi:MAG: cbb3-type cytochrome c oxidase subunit II [Flavobacteriales bacterium]|nr:cbb3-type cytochrome c oxidase subunit II [Flavobacteriales bacterium]
MFNFHKDHSNLVNVSLVVFVGLSVFVAVMPANDLATNNAPLPSMPRMTESERRGLAVYVSENCAACHTQQVRNIEMDKTWGDRPSLPSDYHYSKERQDVWRQSPSLLGSERTGPDLTNAGQRQPGELWHLLHLYDPRLVVKGSIMPRYGWLFEETTEPTPDAVVVPVPAERLRDSAHKVVATQRAIDLVAYLVSLKQAPLPDGTAPGFLPSPGRKESTASMTRPDALPDGGSLFVQTCSACHGAEGMGLPGAFPPLAGSAIVNDADPTLMISIILGGYDARAEYGVMPAQAEQLSDAEIAAIANYLRSSFSNDAPPTTTEAVKTLRSTVAPQTAILP